MSNDLSKILNDHPLPWSIVRGANEIWDVNKKVVFGYTLEGYYDPADFDKVLYPNPIDEIIKFFNANA